MKTKSVLAVHYTGRYGEGTRDDEMEREIARVVSKRGFGARDWETGSVAVYFPYATKKAASNAQTKVRRSRLHDYVAAILIHPENSVMIRNLGHPDTWLERVSRHPKKAPIRKRARRKSSRR